MSRSTKPSVLLISVDAVSPEFIFRSKEKGINLKNISELFLKNGVYSENGMKSIFPTFTYPVHHSMITGVSSSAHEVYNNIVFDPMQQHKNAWNWFVSDRVENLWGAAHENGYISSTVAFPVSVNAPGDYVIPEFWFCRQEIDRKFINAVSRPRNLLNELYDELGIFPTGADLLEDSDVVRYRSTKWMLERKLAPHLPQKPFFLSTYFASYDETTHIGGVGSDRALRALEKIDEMVGELVQTANRLTEGNLVVCLVSDHGSINTHHNISPNALLYQAGLIQQNEKGEITGWQAYSQRAGGCSEIRLRDENDQETFEKVRDLLNALVADEESGVAKILTKQDLKERKAFPLASFALVAKKGYEVVDHIQGGYHTATVRQAAQHGFDEDYEEMRAIFCIGGAGIPKGQKIADANILDVAPTLAAVMGFRMPQAEGKNLLDVAD